MEYSTERYAKSDGTVLWGQFFNRKGESVSGIFLIFHFEYSIMRRQQAGAALPLPTRLCPIREKEENIILYYNKSYRLVEHRPSPSPIKEENITIG